MQDMSVARRAMIVSQLRPQGVTNRAVVAAMATVERERFVPAHLQNIAYTDRSLRLGGERAMMPPAELGRILTEIAPLAGEKALIVGSNTGYSAAILIEMGLDVVALECDKSLADHASAAGVPTIVGELTKGHAKGAPYDVMLFDGAVERLPDALVKQLASTGRIGLAVADRGVTRLAVGRLGGGDLGIATIVDADISLLPGFEKPSAFTF